MVINLKPYERISVFYWMASLKDFFSHRYADFFVNKASYDDDFPHERLPGGFIEAKAYISAKFLNFAV